MVRQLTLYLVAKTALGANIPQESIYSMVFVDGNGEQLTGSRKYVIHFDKDKIPSSLLVRTTQRITS